jgi:DNA-directed RNA polymerase specialized sigma24 family protein
VNPETRIAGNDARRAAGLERAREVMRLHGEGLRGAELAEKLGVSVGSVRSILTRSRRRLGLPTPSRSSVDFLR